MYRDLACEQLAEATFKPFGAKRYFCTSHNGYMRLDI